MRKWMFTMLALASVASSASEVGSQKGEGGLNYREGDPLLFCEPVYGGQGFKKAPEQCWVPLEPISGTYTTMPWCQPINPYGKSWSQDDIRSLAEYQSICKDAVEIGAWDSRDNSEYYDQQPIDR